MNSKSMDDLSEHPDMVGMVERLVDDTSHAPANNWSFASSPPTAGVRLRETREEDGEEGANGGRGGQRAPAAGSAAGTTAGSSRVMGGLPAGVVAVPLEPCFFNTPRVKTPQPDNASSLTKLFVGNMRFEMTREALRWVLINACGVDVPITHVLVHVKAASSNGQPTGCASVYVTEPNADRLLQLNQRIFCSATTLYIAPSVAVMSKLIEDRHILDVDGRGKKLRGPKNSMVIERSRATPKGSFTDMQVHYSPPPYGVPGSAGGESPIQPGSFTSAMAYQPPSAMATPPPGVGGRAGSQPLPGTHNESAPATPPVPLDAPSYEQFPLLPPNGPHSALAPPVFATPVELFVGGIRYEATRTFVAWMLTRALHRRGFPTTILEPQVKLFPPGKRRANNSGCAVVKLERPEAEQLLSVNRCVLCDAYGAYFAPTQESMQRFVSTYHDKMRTGPSHAVVIEMRKSSDGNNGGPQLRPHPGSAGQPHSHHSPLASNASGVAGMQFPSFVQTSLPSSFASNPATGESSNDRAPAVPSWMTAVQPQPTP